MNDLFRRKIQEAVQAFEKDNTDPRILVIGATGAGKSSLINAIFGKKLHEVKTIESTTRSFSTHVYEIQDQPTSRILITDSPGYGEVGHDEKYSEDIVTESRTADAVVLVLRADEKGYDRDLKIIRQVDRDSQSSVEKPLLIALNQVDLIKPSREWNPPYDLEEPALTRDSEKVRNMKAKIVLVNKQFKSVVGARKLLVVPTMSEPDEGAIFGLDRFKLQLFHVLPEVSKYRFARMAKLAEKASKDVLDQLDNEAKLVIRASAVLAAGAVAANFVPVSDFLLLIPIQIGMIIKLGAIYGKTIDKKSAIEVVTTLGAGFAARTIVQGIISLLPIAKNFIGPPAAGAFTHGMGIAAMAYFKSQAVPSENELQAEINREISLSKNKWEMIGRE